MAPLWCPARQLLLCLLSLQPRGVKGDRIDAGELAVIQNFTVGHSVLCFAFSGERGLGWVTAYKIETACPVCGWKLPLPC